MPEERKKEGLLSSLFSHTLLLLNIGAIVWLALCYTAGYTNPSEVKFVALFSLTTAFAIVANLFFIFYWLFLSKKKLRFVLSLITLVLCKGVVLTVFGLNFFSENDMALREGTLRLMTWNVHGMDIFTSRKNDDYVKKMYDYIQWKDADILCLQEFPDKKHDSVVIKPYAKTVMEKGGYKDYRYQFDNTLGTTIYLGTSVFSKYPLQNFKAYQLAEYIYLLQSDVKLSDNNIVRMFFVHLNTFGLSDVDKAYIEEVRKRNTDIKTDLGKSRTFIGKFNYAFEKRAKEVDSARKIIAKSPYPVLICGDFNDMPGSYTYMNMRGDLKDAFLEKGKGLGRTYNQILPTIRIDHLFYDESALEVIGYQSPYTPFKGGNTICYKHQETKKAQNLRRKQP